MSFHPPKATRTPLVDVLRAAGDVAERERRARAARRPPAGWGAAGAYKPYVPDIPHPLCGARQVTFRVGHEERDIRFDADAIPWLGGQPGVRSVRMRIVTRRGAVVEREYPVGELPAALAEYRPGGGVVVEEDL